jgi:hypothetical protein
MTGWPRRTRRRESRHHRVMCSGCRPSHLFSHGVTVVRNFVVFHFCAGAWQLNRSGCNSVMIEVAGPSSTGKLPLQVARRVPAGFRAHLPQDDFGGG